MPPISEDKLSELRESFNHFDTDGNDRIDREEYGDFAEFVAWWGEFESQ